MHQINSEPQPGRFLVSSIIILPEHDPYDILKNILTSIDSVHQIAGHFPRKVPVVWSDSLESSGKFRTDGEGWVEIALSTRLLLVEMGEVLCHEVGHLLDAMMNDFTGFGSESLPLFAPWRESIEATMPVRHLRNSLDIPHVPSQLGTVWANQDMVKYYLKYRELFARCYVQYIATRSNNSDLAKWLQLECSTPLHSVYPTQWSDEEFAPISEALDSVFEEQQWRPKSPK